MAESRAESIQRWVPGVRAAREYQRPWLRSDIVAGLVLAAILVPQGMAYAELAGLPAVTGLYTTIGCLVGTRVFGPSRVLVLGPDSSVSPLIFAAIVPLAATDDPKTAIALAGMLALIVGLIEIGLGVGKLGFVADLLSNEVQVGYMNGLAITIIAGQLPEAVRLLHRRDRLPERAARVLPTPGRDARRGARGRHRRARDPARLAEDHAHGACGARRRGRRHRAVGRARAVGSHRDRRLTPARRPEAVASRGRELSDVGPLLIAAIGITLVSLTDTIATSSAFAARRGDEVDPNQEMIGIGAANIAAGFVQGFAVSTSGSRTAVAEQSGAKSQLTGVVGAGVVVVLLLFLNGLLADLPQAALAAVVIAAALSLLNLGALRRYWPVRPSAVMLSLVASLGVIFVGVLQGIVIAIVLAVLLFFRRNWWPHGAVLGEVEGLDGWHSIDVHADAREHSGIVVYRWEAPLFFANAGAFRRQIRHLVRTADAAMGRGAVRGRHRRRSHGRGDARAARQGVERRGCPHGVRRAPHPPPGSRAAVRPVRDARPRPLLCQRRGRVGSAIRQEEER